MTTARLLLSFYTAMQKLLLVFTCTLLFSLPAKNVLAGANIRGIDLKYTYVAGNTYKITCMIYHDCSILATYDFTTATPEVCIFNDTNYFSTIHLALEPTQYVGYLCAHGPDSNTCNNLAYIYPGYTIYLYSGNVTLPTTSHYWRFILDGNGGPFSFQRYAAITNMTAGSIYQLVDTLDNTTFNNSSPNLALIEPMYWDCRSTTYTYNPMAVDPDGDTLRYYLIPAVKGTSNCATASSAPVIAYVAPCTGASPIGNPPMATTSFSNVTGDLSCLSNYLAKDDILYNIRETRGGVFVGSSQREIVVMFDSGATCIETIPLITPRIANNTDINIYPNPANDELNLYIPGSNSFSYFTITNIQGKELYKKTVFGINTRVDISKLPQGVYFVNLFGNIDRGIGVYKFVKQ